MLNICASEMTEINIKVDWLIISCADTARGRQHHHMRVSSRHCTPSFSVNCELIDWRLWELAAQFVMAHALTEQGKSQARILSCCHSQEVMLLLVNVVSTREVEVGGLRNGAIRSNQALCQFSGFLWFSSACVSCSRKHKACSEKEEEEKK